MTLTRQNKVFVGTATLMFCVTVVFSLIGLPGMIGDLRDWRSWIEHARTGAIPWQLWMMGAAGTCWLSVIAWSAYRRSRETPSPLGQLFSDEARLTVATLLVLVASFWGLWWADVGAPRTEVTVDIVGLLPPENGDNLAMIGVAIGNTGPETKISAHRVLVRTLPGEEVALDCSDNTNLQILETPDGIMAFQGSSLFFHRILEPLPTQSFFGAVLPCSTSNVDEVAFRTPGTQVTLEVRDLFGRVVADTYTVTGRAGASAEAWELFEQLGGARR